MSALVSVQGHTLVNNRTFESGDLQLCIGNLITDWMPMFGIVYL